MKMESEIETKQNSKYRITKGSLLIAIIYSLWQLLVANPWAKKADHMSTFRYFRVQTDQRLQSNMMAQGQKNLFALVLHYADGTCSDSMVYLLGNND